LRGTVASLTSGAHSDDGYPSTAQISPPSIRSGLTDSSACWVVASVGTAAQAASGFGGLSPAAASCAVP
jgi:hypothetical protein